MVKRWMYRQEFSISNSNEELHLSKAFLRHRSTRSMRSQKNPREKELYLPVASLESVPTTQINEINEIAKEPSREGVVSPRSEVSRSSGSSSSEIWIRYWITDEMVRLIERWIDRQSEFYDYKMKPGCVHVYKDGLPRRLNLHTLKYKNPEKCTWSEDIGDVNSCFMMKFTEFAPSTGPPSLVDSTPSLVDSIDPPPPPLEAPLEDSDTKLR